MEFVKNSTFLNDSTFNDFIVYSERFKTDKIKKEYLNNICSFCDYIGCDITVATKSDCEEYVKHLTTRMEKGELSPKSCYAKISIISSFMNYLKDLYPERKLTNYMYEIKRPDISIYISRDKVADYQAIDMLLSEAKSLSDPTMYVVLLLVLKCGLTVSEICNLRKGEQGNLVVDKNNNCGILFMNKYKNRYIKLPADVLKVLGSYLDNRTDNSPYVVVNRAHEQFTQRALERRISRLMEKTFGESGKYTLQDLRNTSITLMVKNSKESDTVKIAETIGVATKWLSRYKYAIEAFNDSPTDLINITIN